MVIRPYDFATCALGRFRLSILTSDPGRVRLRLAVRTMLSMGLVCLALLLLHRWFPMPAPAYAVAMLTALQGAVAIKDATAGKRAVSRIFAALCGFAVIAAISLVEHSILHISAVLLGVIFWAVFIRQFGARWQGVGAFTFMCGVIAAFLKAPDTDLMDIAISLALSGFIAHFVRNFVLPERPVQDFERAIRASLLSADRLQAGVARSLQAGMAIDLRETTRLAHRAQEATFLCESYLPAMSEAMDIKLADLLAMRLFDLRLAIERVLDDALKVDHKTSGPELAVLEKQLTELRDVEVKVRADVASIDTSSSASSPKRPPSVPAAASSPRGSLLANPFFRQAVQVTLASGIAMIVGLALSPERWFWAVMTAFLIFSNTQSRGAVAVRGLNRALGTAVGICVGIGLATLVHGNLYWTIPLVAISIFAAFYLMMLSYAMMTFLITIALSLIYGILGEFTPGLLVLRLEETLVGAFAGIIVSLAVLPQSTREQARQAFDRFLSAFEKLLGDIIAEEGDAKRHSRLIASVTALDTARASFVDAASPMQSFISFGATHRWAYQNLKYASTLAYAAHLLERRFSQTSPNEQEQQAIAGIRARLAHPAENHLEAPALEHPVQNNLSTSAGNDLAANDSADDTAAYAITLIHQTLDQRESER